MFSFQLFVADKLFGLRLSQEEEELGADLCEHGIKPKNHSPSSKTEAFNECVNGDEEKNNSSFEEEEERKKGGWCENKGIDEEIVISPCK